MNKKGEKVLTFENVAVIVNSDHGAFIGDEFFHARSLGDLPIYEILKQLRNGNIFCTVEYDRMRSVSLNDGMR